MPQVEVEGVSLHYADEGQGSALVLLHGLGADLHVWDGDAAVFTRHHRVLRLDVRGFGASEKPPGPYSPGLFARDLCRVLDVCGVYSAHLLGISLGGVIAQRFVLDFPARVRSLVLVSTSSEVGAKSTAAWQRLADNIERRGFDSRTADASRAVSAGFAQRHPEIVAELGRRNAASDRLGYAAAARAVSDYHFTEQLAVVRVPVLILQGLDDQLTPPGGSVKMSRALPQARLLMVPNAGHNLPLEQPDLFRCCVLSFLAGVDFSAATGEGPANTAG